MELRVPLVQRPEPQMQKEISGGTSVNTWLQSGCEVSARVWHIAISVGALVLSVPAQLPHGGRHILFDAVLWPWFPGIMMHVRDVQHVRQPRFRFLDEEGCCSEETWVVDVPPGGGQSAPGKSLQGIDEGLRAFGAHPQHEDQADPDTERRVADHFQGLRELHQKTRYNLFCGRSESNSELGIVATSRWGQDGRCRARIRFHLQDELSRSQSKLQVHRCCASQNVKEKALRARGCNGARSRLTKFGPPTLKLNKGQQVIQNDGRSIHFSNLFSHFCVAGQRKPVRTGTSSWRPSWYRCADSRT